MEPVLPATSVTTTVPEKKRRINFKVILSGLGLIVLLAGIVVGQVLIRRQEEIKNAAASGWCTGHCPSGNRGECPANYDWNCGSSGQGNGNCSATLGFCSEPGSSGGGGGGSSSGTPWCTGSSSDILSSQCPNNSDWTYVFPGEGCQANQGRCCRAGEPCPQAGVVSSSPPTSGGGTNLGEGQVCSSGSCAAGLSCSTYKYTTFMNNSSFVKCSSNLESDPWSFGFDQAVLEPGQSIRDRCNDIVTYRGYTLVPRCVVVGGAPAANDGSNFCSGGCCSADTSRGFKVQKWSCSGFLQNGRCNADTGGTMVEGGYFCIDASCGSQQLDIVDSSGRPAGIATAQNASAVCSSTPTNPPSGGSSATQPPTSTSTNPPSSNTPVISARCVDIKIYDNEWSQLSAQDLTTLQPGDKVRFAVAGSASSGSFSKARFTVNGTIRPEVTTKRPGSEDYYDEYTIPAINTTTTFTIKAELYHQSLGWF